MKKQGDLIYRFDLDDERQVFRATAALEQQLRNERRALRRAHERYKAELLHEQRQLELGVQERQQEFDRLGELLHQLRSTEPLLSFLQMADELRELRSAVKCAKQQAANANAAASRAHEQAYQAQRKASDAEWQARKDFWDRL